MKSLLSTLLAAILVHSATAQQAGDLDVSFGDSGIVLTDIGPTYISQYVEELLPAEDDKFIAMGWYHTAEYDSNYADLALTKYHPTGVIDSSFGEHGKVVFDLSQHTSHADYMRDAALQPDGKIICVGGIADEENITEIGVARFNTDGSVDSSFANNGVFRLNPAYNGDEATCVQVLPDGKILVGYNAIEIFPGVIRLLPNGEIDQTYGSNGFAFVNHAVQDILLQDDDKLLIAGEYNSDNPHWWNVGVTRLDSDGTPDTGFGANGFTYYNHSDLNNPNLWDTWVRSIAIQADGKIIIGGACENTTSMYDEKFALGRLLPNGTLDPSFGTDGKVMIDLPTDLERISKVLVQPDGKIIAAGWCNEAKMVVARLQADGSLDNSFSGNGYFISNFNHGQCHINTAMLTANGNLLVGGTGENELGDGVFFIARILTDLNIGIVELTEGVSNTLLYPNPIEEQARLQFELKQSEELTISLVDMQGRSVQTFISEQEMSQGKHDLQLRFENNLKSGTYLLSISSKKGQMGIRVIKR